MARKRLGLVTTGTPLYSFIFAFKAAQRGDSDDTKDIVISRTSAVTSGARSASAT